METLTNQEELSPESKELLLSMAKKHLSKKLYPVRYHMTVRELSLDDVLNEIKNKTSPLSRAQRELVLSIKPEILESILNSIVCPKPKNLLTGK